MDSEHNLEKLEAMTSGRKLLRQERNPPIDETIELGVVPRCIKFISNIHNSPRLQFEAAWVFVEYVTRMKGGTDAVIRAGGIPRFIVPLQSPYAFVKQQHKFLQYIIWVLSTPCGNPWFDSVKSCLIAFRKLLHNNDVVIQADLCRGLHYLTGRLGGWSEDAVQAVVDAGIVPRLIELLTTSDIYVLKPALLTIFNIVVGTDTQRGAVLEAGGLVTLALLLQHPHPKIAEEAAWMVHSIIGFGTQQEIEMVIQAGLLQALIEQMKEDNLHKYRCKYAASCAVNVLVECGSDDKVMTAVENGALQAFCGVLPTSDHMLLNTALDSIQEILMAGFRLGDETLVLIVEECGGLDKIQALRHHDDEKIYVLANDILEMLFEGIPEEDFSILRAIGSN